MEAKATTKAKAIKAAKGRKGIKGVYVLNVQCNPKQQITEVEKILLARL
jgi:hypothetical protein